MATIAEFTILAEDFPLGQIFADAPEATIELERLVPTTRTLLPYFWIWGDDVRAIRNDVRSYPGIESVSLVEAVDDGGLFRAEWDEETEGVLTAIAELNVTLLKATGNRDKWTFQIRAEETDQLSQFQQYCQDHGIGVTLTRLQSLSTMRDDDYDLTPEQREALVLAFEEGYYDQPRATDLEELAAELGITRQSLSARLNRGYRNLVRNALTEQEEPE